MSKKRRILIVNDKYLLPTFVVIVLIGCLAGWWVIRSADSQTDLLALIPEIEKGNTKAVRQAKTIALRDWNKNRQIVLEMLFVDSWAIRATGCQIISAHGDAAFLPLIIPRCSDADWRVRAAAFEALRAFHDIGIPTPLRDTPLAAREKWLIAWMQSYENTNGIDLARDICDFHYRPVHAEFGKPLANQCLRCHAGAFANQLPKPFEDNQTCAQCHSVIYQQWASSAHAQSLSHLRLATVNPDTGKPEYMNFGKIHGISCTSCHSNSDVAGLSKIKKCPLGFVAVSGNAMDCAKCHSSTSEQWKSWSKDPHPRKATWPPGQIDLKSSDDTRSCTDCHMKSMAVDDKTGVKRHSWSARRNLPLLRSGIDINVSSVRDAKDQRFIVFTLTNLSGHSYPTGTPRRAIQLLVGFDTSDLEPIATFSAGDSGKITNRHLPLKPGEQKTLTIPCPAETETIHYKLIYFRDSNDPNAFKIEIVDLTKNL